MFTIAIADDHLKMRESLVSLISSINDFKVIIETENGYQLIEKLNTITKLPNIILIDVEMPVMDGLSTTNFISHHYPDIKVIAISNHIHENIVIDMLDAGATGFIVKDNLSIKFLKNALNIVSSGSVYIDESLNMNEPKSFIKEEIEKNSINSEITDREKLFLQLTATAISYNQIAKLMNVSSDSIYNYQKSIRFKTGLRTRQEYIIYSICHGIAKIARLKFTKSIKRFSEK